VSAPAVTTSDFFPSIEDEIGDYRRLFTGRVLNAGAGDRDVRALVDGELVNQDIAEGLHNSASIDILSPLHDIPVDDGHFDAILCNAVLEHVRNPVEVMEEFRRVCRPGGTLYLTVPFMQPEHLDPGDFQRYTIDGLQELVRTHGFEVVQAEGVHSVYATLGWIAMDWLRDVPGWQGWAARWLVLPALKRANARSDRHVHSLASAYRVVARRTAT
jgi:SAM-dependent methyltransferase